MRFQGTLRLATHADAPKIAALIARSVHGLQTGDYTHEQRAAALGHTFSVDQTLIGDGSYFLTECADGRLAGAGGWSRRKVLYRGGHVDDGENALIDPGIEPARIRAFFVDPDFARQGVASAILKTCETAALEAGFKHAVLGATLTGAPFYSHHGYMEIGREEAPLAFGLTLTVVQMSRLL